MSYRYHNLDFVIMGSDGDYQVLVRTEESLGSIGASGSFSIELNDDELCNQLHNLHSRRSNREELVKIGSRLFNLVITGNIRSVFDRAIGEIAVLGQAGLRLRFDIEATGLHTLPWELLYAPNEHFVACDLHYPITRYIPTAHPSSLEIDLPLRLLVVIPHNVPPYPEINSDKEKQILTEALNGIEDKVSISWLEGNVTLNDLIHHLPGHHCIHFIGHGDIYDDHGVLLFNKEDGAADFVDDQRFAAIFSGHDQLKLVVLNACQTAARIDHDRMLGVAPQLVDHGIPAVVAMQFPIYDSAALLFSKELYRSLLQGPERGLIDCAVTMARVALSADGMKHGLREFAAPVLFMRSSEGLLFDDELDHMPPFSPNALRRAELIRRTRRANIDSLSASLLTRHDDKIALRYEMECEKLAPLEARIKLGKSLVVATSSIIAVVAFTSWIGLLNVVQLFGQVALTRTSDVATLLLGGLFERVDSPENIALVRINQPTLTLDDRPNHGVVLDVISRAGASTVVFDLFFSRESIHDEEFAAAIVKATSRGTSVVVGANSYIDGEPVISPILKPAVTGIGILCIGTKLGYAAVAPMAIAKADAANGVQPSLALAALMATRGQRSLRIDTDDKVIQITDSPYTELEYSELTRIEPSDSQAQSGCAAIEPGDIVADRYIELSPLNDLRDSEVDYDHVLRNRDVDFWNKRFANKTVLIGLASESEKFGVLDRIGEQRYGMELHADIIGNLQDTNAIQALRPHAQLLLMCGLGATSALIVFLIRNRTHRRIAMTAVTLTYLVVAIVLVLKWQLLLNTVYQLLAFGATYYSAVKAERRWRA